jgi:E3 ubiquitin-protein ligase ZNRF1/2
MVCVFAFACECGSHIRADDLLERDMGRECDICLEALIAGERIARLPCLCVYHHRCVPGRVWAIPFEHTHLARLHSCITDWFTRSRTCPQHPS